MSAMVTGHERIRFNSLLFGSCPAGCLFGIPVDEDFRKKFVNSMAAWLIYTRGLNKSPWITPPSTAPPPHPNEISVSLEAKIQPDAGPLTSHWLTGQDYYSRGEYNQAMQEFEMVNGTRPDPDDTHPEPYS
jgi:hypothetical protein